MNGFLGFILVLGAIGIVVLLCFFSCVISSRADEYWEEIKREMEKRNERH